jgi:hypothetical protein
MRWREKPMKLTKTDVVNPKGYVQMTSLGTQGLLTAVPATATVVLLQAEGDNVRWRDDGTAPTTSVGMRLLVGADVLYNGDIRSIRVIGEGGGAKLNVTYYG